MHPRSSAAWTMQMHLGCQTLGWQQGTHRNTDQSTWPDLALVGNGFVVGPIHDAGIERVAGYVLNLAADGECTARRGKERVG